MLEEIKTRMLMVSCEQSCPENTAPFGEGVSDFTGVYFTCYMIHQFQVYNSVMF